MLNQVEQLAQWADLYIPQFSALGRIGTVVGIVIALLFCFFGYKGLKFFVALGGFLIGALIGIFVAVTSRTPFPTFLVVIIVVGIIVALISFFLYKIGVFLTVAVSVGGTVFALLSEPAGGTLAAVVAIAAGILVAVLAVKHIRTVVIWVSGLAGGLAFAYRFVPGVLGERLSGSSSVLSGATGIVIIGLAVSFLGILFQYRTTKKEK